MELQAGLELIKSITEVSSPVLLLVLSIWYFYSKEKESALKTAEKIGTLQSEQLGTLIKQNTELGLELHSVRQELTAAYIIIKDMRNRVLDLENAIGLKAQTDALDKIAFDKTVFSLVRPGL